MTMLLPFLKSTAKRSSWLFCKMLGIELLTKQQTEAALRLQAEQLVHDQGDSLTLGRVVAGAASKQLFPELPITTASRAVWRLRNHADNAQQLPSGNIVFNGKGLDLGFGNAIIAKDLLLHSRRQVRFAKILLAPWPHYWTGYFDYIFFIAMKLCRLKASLLPEELAEAVVCYPLFHSAFEREILAVLGFRPENILDSRTTKVEFDTCLLGNNDNWFYPNRHDIAAFKSLIAPRSDSQALPSERLYIQRTGRRKVVNEAELLGLLKKYGFTLVEDKPRSFAEQVSLYQKASFIIGPHGASFANILSCRAGTQLLELFPSTYMPDYFRYLAHMLDLRYAAYCVGQPLGSAHRHVQDDIVVELGELEHQLDELLYWQAA